MGKPRKEAEERADEEDRIQHGWHREHPIRLRFHAQQYKCDGCGEHGYGFRYRCDLCSFDLHAACARAPAASWHPCHPRHALLLQRNVSGEARTCDICDQDSRGAVYSCRAAPDCDFDAHPTCLKLPLTTFHALHPQHRLDLYLPLPPSSPHAPFFGDAPPPDRLASCYVCRRNFKAGVASYSCATDGCRFRLHVKCAKVPVDPFAELSIPEAPTHDMGFSCPASASASVSSDFMPSPQSTDSGDEIREEPPPGPSVSSSSVRSLQRQRGFNERLRCLGPG